MMTADVWPRTLMGFRTCYPKYGTLHTGCMMLRESEKLAEAGR